MLTTTSPRGIVLCSIGLRAGSDICRLDLEADCASFGSTFAFPVVLSRREGLDVVDADSGFVAKSMFEEAESLLSTASLECFEDCFDATLDLHTRYYYQMHWNIYAPHT